MSELPSWLRIAVRNMSAVRGTLMAEELPLLEGANSTRRQEIISGRTLARELMAEMGFSPAPIVRRAIGSPIWPKGLCGSIAHSNRHVAVVLAPSRNALSVGVDIEDGRGLGPAWTEVASEDEVASFSCQEAAADNATLVREIFSAKEALYKCQSPITGNEDLGHLDVAVMRTSNGSINAVSVKALDQRTADAVSATIIKIQEFCGVTLALAWVPRSTEDFV